jgi:ribose transport system permease protein
MSTGESAGAMAPQSGTAGAMKRRRSLGGFIQGQGLILMLVIIVVFFATQSDVFLTWDNFFTIGGTSAGLGIMAVAQTYVIIAKQFDVSVGAVVAMSGVVIAKLVSSGANPWIGLVAAIVAAILIGLLNGFFVLIMGVNPLITTLGTMSIFSGLAFTIIPTNQVIEISSPSFNFLGNGYIGPVPFPMILLLVAVAVAFVFERRTIAGRQVYAIGANLEAARLSGIRVKLIPWSLFVVSSVSGAIAGAIITSQLSSASPAVGESFLLSVVTAVILGGASLAGGSGSVVGTLIAVAILGTLDGGFALMGLPSYVQTMALGAALIAAVLLQQASHLANNRELRSGSGPDSNAQPIPQSATDAPTSATPGGTNAY